MEIDEERAGEYRGARLIISTTLQKLIAQAKFGDMIASATLEVAIAVMVENGVTRENMLALAGKFYDHAEGQMELIRASRARTDKEAN